MKKSLLIAAVIISAGLVASTVIWQRTAAEKRAHDAASKAAFSENMRRVVRREEIALAIHALDGKIAAIVAEKDELRRMDTENDLMASRNDSTSAALAAQDIARARSSLPATMAAAEIRRIQEAHEREVKRHVEYRKMAANDIRKYEDTIALLRDQRQRMIEEAESLGPVPYPVAKK